MAVNKVVFKTETLIDLTSDTAVASDVAEGKTFHDASGALVTGTASGGGTKYEEEDLPGGGFWAKINYIESYPEVPGASERRQMSPYLQSMSGEHCTVYVKKPSTGAWETQSWSDTNVTSYTTTSQSDEEFCFRLNLKIVPDPGYKIDPTNIPFYNEFVNGNYGSVYAGIYSGYKTDMTGNYTVWGNIIDIDDDGVGYAAVCWPLSYPVQTGNSVDVYCKAIPI